MRRFEFILYVFFYEVVFGLSVYGFGYFQAMPFSLLWSLILGAPAVVLLMNIKGKKLLPIVDGLLRVLYAIPFLVEYFIYMQFKELYDLNTIMNGAGGALTGFTSTIMGLIFSPLGIFHLFLYSIPLSILIMDLKRKKYDYSQPEKQIKTATAVMIPVALVFNIIIIACIPSARNIVGNEYNYPKAVEAFGKNDDFTVIITPEGTRKQVKRFKRGFYEIATNANVPIAITYINYKTRHMGVEPLIMPSGDFDADMRIILDFYSNVAPRNDKGWNIELLKSTYREK